MGFGLLERGLGTVVLLGADGLALEKVFAALRFRAGKLEGGLGVFERGLGNLVVGLVASVVQLVERLARCDEGALGEEALLDDAVHLRTYFGDEERSRSAWELAGDDDFLALDFGHGDGGSWPLHGGWIGGFLRAAAGEQC